VKPYWIRIITNVTEATAKEAGNVALAMLLAMTQILRLMTDNIEAGIVPIRARNVVSSLKMMTGMRNVKAVAISSHPSFLRNSKGISGAHINL